MPTPPDTDAGPPPSIARLFGQMKVGPRYRFVERVSERAPHDKHRLVPPGWNQAIPGAPSQYILTEDGRILQTEDGHGLTLESST